jgi:hypothetical protein
MMRNRSLGVTVLLCLACAFLSSCGGSSAPIAVAFPAGTQAMLDPGQSQNFTITLTHDTKNQGVTWSLASAGTLSNVTTTSVTYNAPAGPLTATVTDHLTATSVADKTKSVTLTITITPAPTITTTSPLPAGVNGTPYSQQLAASGGAGTLSFALSGGTMLPAGLTMSSSGLITGTPSGSNVTANFTVTVSDQGTGTPAATASKGLSIHIAPAPVLLFTTTTLKNGNTNVPYSDAVVTSGGIAPVTFSITAGALPHGLLLNATTGAITGTPDTTANNFGTFRFTVQATDKAIPPQTPSQSLSITIIPPALSITNATLPNGQVGINYSGTVQASGGFPPLVYSVNAGSALPNGLSIDSATGAITGKPTVANPTATFTIQVKDAAAQVKTQAYTVVIAPAISVALTTPPPANLQATLTVQVAATVSNDAGGLGVDWSVTCGSASCGAFSPTHTASGANTTYTAPAAVPTGGTVTITAKSTADPTKSASGVTTITPPPIIVTFVMAPPSSLQVSTSVMVSAHVANDVTSAGVDWSVTCGSASCGSFTVVHTASDATTTFTAPASVPTGNTVTIKATSTANATKSVSSATTITLAPPISVAITQQPASSLVVGGTAMVTATVTNDPATGGGVDWTVTCGSAGACGSFSLTHTASGAATVYTAPASVPTGNTVTIKATSTADNTKSANANTVTITALVITVSFTTAPPSSLAVSGTASVTASVSNDTMTKGVDWTVTCGSAACGSFSATHTASGTATTYTAPAAVPTGNTVTIKATSTADNTKFITATVTITASIAACGSGHESVFKGQYAFLFQGFDASGPVAIGGVFSADGTGKIALLVGVMDINAGAGVQTSVAIDSVGSSFSVGADNRGCLTIATGTVTFKYAISLGSLNGSNIATKGRMIEVDNSGTLGSGVLRLQDSSAFTTSAFVGNNYAFGAASTLTLSTAGANRFAVLGSVTVNSSSSLTGEEDFNFSGQVDGGSTTGAAVAITGGSLSVAASGRGTFSLTVGASGSFPGGTFNFSAYVVSASEFLFMNIGAQSQTNPLFAGSALKQSGGFSTSSLSANMVLYSTGICSTCGSGGGPGPQLTIGVVTIPSPGSFSFTADQASGATLTSSFTFVGTYTVDASGRVLITRTGHTIPGLAVYLVNPNQGFFGSTGTDVNLGFAEPQTGGPNFTNASLSGAFSFGTTEKVTQNVSDNSGVAMFDGLNPGTISGTSDMASLGSAANTNTFSQPYSVTNGSGTPGRGTVMNNSGTNVNLIFYIISPSKIVLINVRGGGGPDPNPPLLIGEK